MCFLAQALFTTCVACGTHAVTQAEASLESFRGEPKGTFKTGTWIFEDGGMPVLFIHLLPAKAQLPSNLVAKSGDGVCFLRMLGSMKTEQKA